MGAVGVSFSPLARALARRLSGEAKSETHPAELDELREEIAALRAQLDEVHNRLDFAERMLAQAKARGALSGGQD